MTTHRDHDFVLCVLLAITVTGCFSPEDTLQSDRGTASWFQDEAQSRGLNFRHHSGSNGQFWTPEIMGGGAALADVDGDGDLDAYFVQSGSLVDNGAHVPGNELYFNNGEGYFRRAEPEMIGSGADRGYGMGVTAGDYDNDGDVDLYVTNWGGNVLLRNTGNGHFEDVTELAGVGNEGWGTAAAFLDLDNDEDLDLFLVNYLNWSPGSAQDCVHTYCGPNPDDATMDRLYRNDGDGSFTDISINAGLNAAFGNGLGITGADFNADGLLDVFVANDGMANQLWLNQGNLKFSDEAFMWGCAMDDHGIAKAGMGVVSTDQDNDGDADILVMNLEKQTDSFFRNEGTHFIDATSRVGLAGSSRRYTRFGVALADFDNDGDLDLYEANGRIDHSPEHPGGDAFAEPNSLYQQSSDGRFVIVGHVGGAVPELIHTSRGVAQGDVDNDGGLDLLVINRDAPAYLLMNQVDGRANWTRFRLIAASGRDAYNARISGIIGDPDDHDRHYRYVQTAGSYLVSHDPRVHFGLGESTRIRDVRVRWPSGKLEAFGDFEAGRNIELHVGSGQFLE